MCHQKWVFGSMIGTGSGIEIDSKIAPFFFWNRNLTKIREMSVHVFVWLASCRPFTDLWVPLLG